MAIEIYQCSGLNFEPVAHKYSFHGKEIPSVTSIIKRANLVDERFFNDEGRLRGTAVHEAVFLSIHNILDRNNLHKIIEPYFVQWEKFLIDSRFIPIKRFCESCLFNPTYHYAGKIDLLGNLNGRHALIDIKTGSSIIAPLQTAAYAAMPPIELYRPRRYSLQLKPDRYILTEYTDKQDFIKFIRLLRR